MIYEEVKFLFPKLLASPNLLEKTNHRIPN